MPRATGRPAFPGAKTALLPLLWAALASVVPANQWPQLGSGSISVLDADGNLLGRYGAPEEGEEPGRFIAPHGIAVDSHGDVYVGEVSYTIRGSRLDPPRELKSLKKLRRVG